MMEEIEEHGVKINVKGTTHSPKKNDVMFNSEMAMNRSVVLCALATFSETNECIDGQIRCLDALGATGVSGLAWARQIPKAAVVINDPLPAAAPRIKENASANGLEVDITTEDVSVLLRQRPFDFILLYQQGYLWVDQVVGATITLCDLWWRVSLWMNLTRGMFGIQQAPCFNDTYLDRFDLPCVALGMSLSEEDGLEREASHREGFLDCYGSSVHYLDAAFRNAPKHGILVITSTDDAAFYGKAADVTLRNYGGYIVRTSYAKELAARLVLASVVRAAAKCNKGIEVVCCVALKSYITVIVRVIRGPSAANKCVHRIRHVIHCCMCEDRAFYPQTVHPLEQPYSFLSCDCRSKSAGKSAVELGPVWCDEIFDPVFCQIMLSQANNLQLPHKVTSLFQTIVSEAKCNDHPCLEMSIGGDKENTLLHGHMYHCEDDDDDEETSAKRLKTDHHLLRSPPFYFNLHRYSPKGYDLGKINKIVEYLRCAKHKASRTHFDPEAIRTTCTLAEFSTLLVEFSKAQA